MKRRKSTVPKIIIKTGSILVLTLGIITFKACKPIQGFMSKPEYAETSDLSLNYPKPKPSSKTIILIADNQGTEIFDLLAPYYILKASTNANVFIVSKHDLQIPLHRGLSILPHHTFESFDALDIRPDAIVIPNLSTIMPAEVDIDIIAFIKQNYDNDTYVLSVCDGAATAAKTGIFDDRQMTAHASDIPYFKKWYPNIEWKTNKRYTISDNLIATAGVSNATEGTLMLISMLFDANTVEKAIKSINYPSDSVLNNHQSNPINFSDKVNILSKVTLKGNKKIGVLLEDNVSEFNLAALLDTYSRTFPKSIDTFSDNGKPVTSKHGLTLIPTESLLGFDTLMCLDCDVTKEQENNGTNFKKVILDTNYVFDQVLNNHIGKEFNESFTQVVAKLLDYNPNQKK